MRDDLIDLMSRRDPSSAEQIRARLRAMRRDPRESKTRAGSGAKVANAPTESSDSVRAFAAHVRTQAAAQKNRRLSSEDRVTLAVNMTSILAPLREKRGALSAVLLNAQISKTKTDHTKRLPQYTVKDREQANPKVLSSCLMNYVRLAEKAAERLGGSPDTFVLRLVEGTPYDPRLANQRVPIEEFLRVQSLYELLTHASEAIAAKTNLLEYFRALARWRWLPTAKRDVWILDDVSAPPQKARDHEFLRSRFSLLPKVELASFRVPCNQRHVIAFPTYRWNSRCLSMKDIESRTTVNVDESSGAMDITLPESVVSEDIGNEVNTDSIRLDIRGTVWWGLVPADDGSGIEGCIMSSLDLVVSGEAIIDDSRIIALGEHMLPGDAYCQRTDSTGSLVFESIFELEPEDLQGNLYIDAAWEADTKMLKGLPPDFGEREAESARIQPLSLSTLFSHLIENGTVESFDRICGQERRAGEPVSGTGPIRAPRGTLAAEVESHLRYSRWDDPQRADLRLYEVCQILQEQMTASTRGIEESLEESDAGYRAMLENHIKTKSGGGPDGK